MHHVVQSRNDALPFERVIPVPAQRLESGTKATVHGAAPRLRRVAAHVSVSQRADSRPNLEARARFDRRIVVCRTPWLAEACRRVHHVTQSRNGAPLDSLERVIPVPPKQRRTREPVA